MTTTNPEPGGDDHGRAGPPADAVIKRGYEEDGYDAKSVISVPILVVVFFVLAFGTVTIMFAYFRESPVDPMAQPQTVEDNSRGLNERIASTPERGRPEPLKMLDGRGANPRAITRPPLAEGNPPEYHPEDIRPSLENTPALYETKWVVRDQVARVSLDEARELVKKGTALKARPGAVRPRDSYQVPSGSNAGRALLPATPVNEGKP
jgi:hypothetical protein